MRPGQREIDLYLKSDKTLANWKKAYLQAIFDSNVGDPLAAFNNLTKYENELIESDYAENYFYISQRAGELEKSELILNKIIKYYKEKNKNISDMLFQKAFLFYQSKRYSDAYKIGKKQKMIMDEVMKTPEIASNWENLDLKEIAEKLVQ